MMTTSYTGVNCIDCNCVPLAESLVVIFSKHLRRWCHVYIHWRCDAWFGTRRATFIEITDFVHRSKDLDSITTSYRYTLLSISIARNRNARSETQNVGIQSEHRNKYRLSVLLCTSTGNWRRLYDQGRGSNPRTIFSRTIFERRHQDINPPISDFVLWHVVGYSIEKLWKTIRRTYTKPTVHFLYYNTNRITSWKTTSMPRLDQYCDCSLRANQDTTQLKNTHHTRDMECIRIVISTP